MPHLFKSKEDAIKAIEILQWRKDNPRESCSATARHWNVDRRLIAKWENNYKLEGIIELFGLQSKYSNSEDISTEKIIPANLIAKAEKALSNLTDLTELTSRVLIEWVNSIIEKIEMNGIKALNVYELDRLIKIQSETSKYTLPSSENTVKTTSSIYEETKAKLAESRKALHDKYANKLNVKS